MFLVAALLGMGVGLARGGRFQAFGDVRFRSVGLVFAAFGLRLLLGLAGARGWTGIAPWAATLHLGSYALLIYALYVNRRLPGVWLLIAGTVANAAVIAANGARMPVLPGAMRALGETADIRYLAGHGDYMHSLMGAATRLPWLGDRFVLALPAPSIFSLGDVFIVLGLVMLIQGVMVRHRQGRPASTR